MQKDTLALTGVILGAAAMVYAALAAHQAASDARAALEINRVQFDMQAALDETEDRVEHAERLIEGQAVLIKVLLENDPDTANVITTAQQGELASVLDYLDDIPRDTGRAVEKAGQDIVDAIRSLGEI